MTSRKKKLNKKKRGSHEMMVSRNSISKSTCY